MLDFLSEHFGDIILGLEILFLALFGKPPVKFSKRLAKQERKVAKDYERLKADESVLEDLKKGGEE